MVPALATSTRLSLDSSRYSVGPSEEFPYREEKCTNSVVGRGSSHSSLTGNSKLLVPVPEGGSRVGNPLKSQTSRRAAAVPRRLRLGAASPARSL